MYHYSLLSDEDEDDLIKSTLLSSTKTTEIEMTDLSEPGWMDDYKKCCRLLS